MYRKLLLLSLFILISCNKNNINDKLNIIVNLGLEPRSIDPALNASNPEATYILTAFEGLTKKDKDNNIIPGISERWDISDDGIKYTFHLRTNAKWSDGKEIIADDFVYSWRRLVDPNTGTPFSSFLEPIKNAKEIIAGEKPIEELGVKAIDDYTFEVILQAPTAYFLDFTGYFMLCPVRKDVIEKYGDEWTLKPESYIGNGPFRLIERKIDERMVLVKNTNYWDYENVKPEKITFLMMNDSTAALAGVKNGNIHLSKVISRITAPKLKKENLIDPINLLSSFFLRVDLKNRTLQDVRIRKALSLAIDRDYIVKNITLMDEKVAYFYIPSETKNYDIIRDHSYISQDYSKNLEEAKKLLAEAGYPNGNNFPVLHLYFSIRDSQVEVCEAIQTMWKENLGIDVIGNKYEYSTFMQLALSGEIQDLLQDRFNADFNDPFTFLHTFQYGNSFNYLDYSNAKYNNLLNVASTNNDLKHRTELLYKAEKVLLDDVGMIPIFDFKDIALKVTNLKGIEYDYTGVIRFNNSYLE